jgi:TP901 family phage tail tape measure protein
MAGDTNSNIFINIDTSQAMTQLRLLEKELTTLNRSLIVGTKTAAAAQSKYAQSLLHNVNATGQWTASMTRMSTASEQFAKNLDKQKLSLKEYFRYGAASTKTFGKMFGSEFDTIGKLVDKRVKTLQQQYVQLGRDAQGAMNAMKFNPKALNYGNVTTQLMAATQRQQIFNKLVDDGSTKLLNFGKNTQWAGRQLMVGFTIPLMLFGSQAIKTFKEIETQVIRFKKVYGDIFTDQGATAAALKNIRDLGDEYTKYGLKVSDTIKMAADAAAAGFSGKGLEALVEQTNKLAVLGGVTQEKALETTIALKNAFQIDTGDMAGTIDFLNAVENQTVVALDDLTEAIPKVAPVIQQLGGDVKDLAYFMAAMQEGGISAAQGANALKSGLASLINPSNAASKAAAAVGINIKGIVEANAGNLRNTVTGFAQALQPLTDLERSRVIEKVFGKYQFARISALLNNLGREGTQAARVLQLTNASVEELAILSQRELKVQADSPMNKFVGSVERLKAAIAPIGELFAKVLTPAIEFISRIADKFNSLPDGIKKAIGIITVVVGGLGPLFLMTFGLLANAVANSVKGIQVLRKGYQQLSAGSSDAALKTQYLSQEELENISISNALYSKHQQLSAAYQLEAAALTSLTSVYRGASAAMGGFAGQNPGLFMPGKGGMPRRFAEGTTSVPGPRGAGDVVPSMLSPGEAVIPAKQSQKYSGFIGQIIKDKVPGFAGGLFPSFGAAATVGKGIPLSAGPAAFREAQQARYAARDAARRGLSGNVAPVVPISSRLSGIRYSAEGSKVRVSVGDESFLIPAGKLDNFKKKLKENEDWMVANKRTDTTEQELLRTIKRKGYGGKDVTPSQIYSRLPKFSNARNSQQNQDIADKRFRALLKSRNPHLVKLQNYLVNEEKLYLEKVLGQDVVKSLKGWDVNKLTPSHIREVRSQNRTPEDWAPSKIARDWGWFNSGLRGTKFGNVKGGHPLNAAQAREVLTNLQKTPFDKLPNEKKALQAALEYRLSRKPSYYDDFIFTDNAMMKVKPTMNLAEGIVSVPGPKGAGDIQPAMLSPGESVIPAKQSAKYMPLIQSMVADKVPGYENSNVNPFSGTKAPPGMVYTPSGLLVPAGGGQASAASRSPDRVEKAIDKFFDKPRVKKLGDRIDKFAAQMGKTTPTVARLENTVTKTTQAFGTDKTRGFRGFIGGYGNVSQTVTGEDGNARAASASERTNMRQMNRMNFSQKMMPAQMAGMMIPMAAGMYAQKNPDSGIAKNMDVIMMLSMLTMLLPMLNSPLKLLAATAVGLVAIFKMQAATIRKNVIEGQKQAESMSMTTKNLEELGKITGKVSITQTAAAVRAGRNTDISPVSIDFGRNLIDSSDFGKKLKSTFESSLEFLGEGAAVNSLVNQLGTAVTQGVLGIDQAESIAVALTRNLKDARLEVNVRGRLIQLLGPNGENILENPLKLQLDLLSAGEKVILSAVDKLNKVAKDQVGINTKTEVGQLVGGGVGGGLLGARAGLQAANMMQDFSVARGATSGGNIQSALKAAKAARLAGTAASAGVGATGVGAVPGLVGIAISTVIFGGIEAAIRNWQKGKEKAAIGKAAGIVQGLISQNLSASQGSIDALTSVFNTSIANLELKKKTLKTDKERAAIDLEIAGLEVKRQDGLKTLRQEQAKMLASVSSSYDKVSGASTFEKISPFGSGRGQVRDKFMEAFSVGMQDKFKDNAPLKAQAAALQSQLDQLGKDQVTVEISTLVTSDVLTPNEASTLLNTLTKAGGNISKNLEAFIDVQGTEGLQRLSTILTMIESEENQKALLLEVELMDKAGADAVFNSIEELGKIPPFVGIDLEIETDASDIDALEARGKEIDKLKGKFPDGKVTLEALIKMQEEAGGVGKNLTLDSALKYWDQISKLDKNVQLQAIITVSQIEFSDSFDKILDRELDAAFEKANPKYAGQQVFATDERRRQFQRQEKIDREMFKNDAKNRAAAEKAAMDSLIPKVFPTAPVSGAVVPGGAGGAGEKAKRDESFLDDLVQRLKLVKEGAFNALKPMESLRKFLNRNTGKTENDYLQKQDGAIKQIEAAAKNAEALKKIEKATGNKYGGEILIDKDFMEIIRSLDAEQFALWTEKLFEVDKAGNITALKEDFVVINEGFRKATIGGYIQDVKDASKEIENQVAAHEALTKEGYNSLEIQKILQNVTLTAKIAAQGGLQATKEEQAELNKEIQKTINLNYQLSMIKLSDNISETKMQVEAFKRLTAAGVKHEVILEILKDKNNAFAIASADATVNTKDKFGDLIAKTKQYSDLLELIANQTKTFEQTTQEAIDANVSALDLQARTLQNQFDIANIGLKAKIKTAEIDVKSVNDSIQKEQDKIDKINLTLKYDPGIGQNFLDDLQEKINDAQRSMDINFDRPLQVLSDRSAVLSNDLTLIDKATEAINEKYDAQEKALQTISQLNSDIAAQEKSRISLADALSQGDISAAAQLANDMRTTAAEAANRKSGEFIAASRKAETDNVVSASGMTKAQIEAEQFRISQQSYALEQQRKTVQVQILSLEDQVYNITELREAKLLSIRDIETIIDGLKSTQLANAQATLDRLQAELDKNQEILDAKLLAIENEKLAWDSVQIKLDAYKLALTNSKLELESMLTLIGKIAAAMATIPTTTATKSSAFVPTVADTGGETPEEKAARLKREADAAAQKAADEAAQKAADAAAAKAAVLSGYATAKAAGDMNAAALFAAKVNPSALAAQESGAIGAASIAAQLKAAERALVASNAVMKQASTLASFKAKEAAELAASNIKGRVGRSSGGIIPKYMSSGGMAPKYFAVGGKARGTDIIPAMLTPGEFVMSKYAVDSYGVDKMKAINSGSYEGEKVYNYNLNVNVKSDANPEDIARVVMTQIRQVDSQRIRTQRG